jgi:enoyl-CoA hydratase
MQQSGVRYQLEDRVATVSIDDGRVNAVSPALLEALNATIDQAEREARVLLLCGRPGRFSAGFDLAVLKQGGQAASDLVVGGARLALRLYGCEIPVVIACSGHAIAMGAILLMAGDSRIGAAGEFRIGLNEVAIGMPLPPFAVEFARERLAPGQLARAVVLAELYGPDAAREAGYLDRVVPAESLLAEARAEAAHLAKLDPFAHGATKRLMRGAFLARVEESLQRPLF